MHVGISSHSHKIRRPPVRILSRAVSRVCCISIRRASLGKALIFVRLEFLKSLVPLEAGTVTFPSGPTRGAIEQGQQLVCVANVDDVVVPIPGSDGARCRHGRARGRGRTKRRRVASGCGLFAPAPANVPVLVPLPPKPV